MNRTLRKVLGYKTRPDGESVILLLETVEGVRVEIEVIPEAIMEIILALLSGRTEAWVRSEGGVEGPIPDTHDRIRGVIPAKKFVLASYPDLNKRLVQIETEGGAIVEFLLPAPDRATGV
ncbi:hypothetical protein [Agrobacterium pusense]|uniref:Uncharacterized protein n=2 Tax=Agrobacterium pusense TaxID=648995 RepID=A0AA44EJS9_9HYPH|nr:hypothetical protein [Agrobacterium pusense]NRF19713.1 hypothetical protein [Agrobacterium pusense]